MLVLTFSSELSVPICDSVSQLLLASLYCEKLLNSCNFVITVPLLVILYPNFGLLRVKRSERVVYHNIDSIYL